MIASLFRRRPKPPAIEPLYGAIMAAALRPELYARLGAPDTFEGRFEAAALHMALVMNRLAQLPPPADEASQALVNLFFDRLDAAMREKGIGDNGLSRRMKAFAKGFYGRLKAYDEAGEDRSALGEALGRNLLEGGAASDELIDAALALRARIAAASLDDLLARPEALFAR